MHNSLAYYTQLFLRLKRANGVAPHKPVLLLTILEAVQIGLINSPQIYISPDLIALFKTIWNKLVTTNHDPRFSYPFYYMKSEKFWQLVLKAPYDNVALIESTVKSFNAFNNTIKYAVIDHALFELIAVNSTNKLLSEIILDKYFPETKYNYNILNPEDPVKDIENKILFEPAESYKKEMAKLIEAESEEEIFVRGAIFRREVPKIYNYTCCISGMRISTGFNISMVDACHIVPFSQSYDDTIHNGLALCPNLHRAFDRGILAINENYEVVISKDFREEDSPYSIVQFEGKRIILPQNQDFWPLQTNLKKHRETFNL